MLCRSTIVLVALAVAMITPSVRAQQLTVNNVEFPNRATFVAQGRRCATDEPNALQRRRAALAGNLFRRGNAAALKKAKIVIPVVFHIIHDKDTGKLGRDTCQQQVDVLNGAYKQHDVEFTLKDVTYTDNPEWFTMTWRSEAEYKAKNTLSTKQPTKELNFYTANLGGGLLGWATFPSDLSGGDPTTPYMDGVVCLYTSLPGVATGQSPFDLGMTGVHEVGHWLGLYHTFQGGCAPPGDEVEDTPAEASPAFGCPEQDEPDRDTCEAAAGKDPTKNYMDYADDKCMHEFSSGQVERMKVQVGAFRPNLVETPPDARIQGLKVDAKTLDAMIAEP